MKVLHLNSNYLHTPLYSEMLIRLESAGIKNTVIMPRKNNDDKHLNKEVVNLPINIHHDQILNQYDRLFYYMKQRKVRKWIKSLNLSISDFDLIHAHTLFTDGYLAYKENLPYVITVRNTDLNYFFKYYKHLLPLGKKILNKASKIIFLSKKYRDTTALKLYKNTNERQEFLSKSMVIPNGINNGWIKNDVKSLKQIKIPIKVLFVGRIMKNKNILFVINNLKELSNKYNLEFHIVGEVINYKYYKKIMKNNNVIFHGKLNQQSLRELMRKMTLFTMVSHRESFGLVYLEALTQSLPILYTSGQGFDKYFKDGFVGYPVNSRKKSDFQKKFEELIANYNQIQSNIKSLNYSNFSWDENVRRHIEIYQNI